MSFFFSFFAKRFRSPRTLVFSRSGLDRPERCCALRFWSVEASWRTHAFSRWLAYLWRQIRSPRAPRTSRCIAWGQPHSSRRAETFLMAWGIPFLGWKSHSECNQPSATSLILPVARALFRLFTFWPPGDSIARIQETLTRTFSADDRAPDPVVGARSQLNFQCQTSRFYRESGRLRYKHHLDPRHVAPACSAQHGI